MAMAHFKARCAVAAGRSTQWLHASRRSAPAPRALQHPPPLVPRAGALVVFLSGDISGSCECCLKSHSKWAVAEQQKLKGSSGTGLGLSWVGLFQGKLYQMFREGLDGEPSTVEVLAAHPDLLGDR